MPEYREGPEAKETFEKSMKAIFQAPKAPTPRKTAKAETPTLCKKPRLDKNWAILSRQSCHNVPNARHVRLLYCCHSF